MDLRSRASSLTSLASAATSVFAREKPTIQIVTDKPTEELIDHFDHEDSTPTVVKVAVTVVNSSRLLELDQTLPLDQIIETLCLEHGISWKPSRYALQLTRLGSSVTRVKYITQENRFVLRHGAELKLSYAPAVQAAKILQEISPKGSWDTEECSKGRMLLAELARDRTFLEAFSALPNAVDVILTYLVNGGIVKDINYVLETALWLVRHHLVSDLGENVLKKVAAFVRSEHTVDTKTVEKSLHLLEAMCEPPCNMSVVGVVSPLDLIPLLWDQERPDVQAAALALLNVYADRESRLGAACPEARANCIKIITSLQVRETIVRNILNNPVDSVMSRQLLHLQNFILEPVRAALNVVAEKQPPGLKPELPKKPVPSRRGTSFSHSRSWTAEDSAVKSEKVQQRSSLVETHYKQLPTSTSVPSSPPKEQTNKRASAISTDSTDSANLVDLAGSELLHVMNPEVSGSTISLGSDASARGKDGTAAKAWAPDDGASVPRISALTADCLRYFQDTYPSRSAKAVAEEEAIHMRMPLTAERLTRLLVGILDSCEMYQPLIFTSPFDIPFLPELFCKTVSLLGKTRREMRAKTAKDQDKVLRVLKRQIREGMRAQVSSWDKLEIVLNAVPYSRVVELWESERKVAEQNKVLSSPTVAALRKKRTPELLDLVRHQRIAALRNGARFPHFTQRQRSQKGYSKRGYIFMKLVRNDSALQYAACKENNSLIEEPESLQLSSVTEVVTGSRCPHLRGSSRGRAKQSTALAFSLLLDPNECETQSMDFVAPDIATLESWVDGLNILLGKEKRSVAIQRDLDILLDMEIRLQLLELEGIALPTSPPSVPMPPPDYDFALP